MSKVPSQICLIFLLFLSTNAFALKFHRAQSSQSSRLLTVSRDNQKKSFFSSSPLTNFFNEKVASTISREVIGRTYAAQKDVFFNVDDEYTEDNITSTEKLDTFSPVKSVWFRSAVVLASFASFPFFVGVARPLADLADVDAVTSAVLPGVGILFGTLIALTYQILFDRQSSLEDVVTNEIGCLSIVANELEYIFQEDTLERREAFRCVCKQADTLINKSRIEEISDMMNSRDPLVKLLDILNKYTMALETCDSEYECDILVRKEQLQSTFIPSVREMIQKIIDLRSKRLHQENTDLPATHFSILTLLALYQVLSFTFVVAGTIPPEQTTVSFESRLAFGCLTGVFTLAINFALDLNGVFDGVYQIRRSATSAILVQVFQTVKKFYDPEALLAGLEHTPLRTSASASASASIPAKALPIPSLATTSTTRARARGISPTVEAQGGPSPLPEATAAAVAALTRLKDKYSA